MTVKTNYLANILGTDPEALMALREIPAFRDSSGSLLELMFRYGKMVLLEEGEELTREGEFDQWVFFVIKGRLAVTVSGEHVDTISSSLVGERCILGEHRRATLRAMDEGVTALGLDMALLDALRDRSGAVTEPISVYIELLSIITGEVMNRIAELEFNLIDFTYKYRTHQRSERLSEVLGELAHNAYLGDRAANFTVSSFLNRHHPVVLSRCRLADGYTVDTRKLYADAVLAGDHALLYAVAEAVLAAREQEPAQSDGRPPGTGEEASFAHFCTHIAQAISHQHGAQMWGESAREAMAVGIRKRMELGEGLTVDLQGLMAWLVAEYRFTAEDTIDLLMTLLKESSDYTARINGRIKSMVAELTQTRFAKELESAAHGRRLSVAEYYTSTPLEDLIPFFSKNILDVYLVHPYVERIHAADEGQWDSPGDFAQRDRDEMLTSLFK